MARGPAVKAALTARMFVPASLLVAVVSAVMLRISWSNWVETPLMVKERSTIVIQRGSSVVSVIAQMEAMGLTRYDWRWRLLNRLARPTVRAGEYELAPGMTPEQVLSHFASGDVVRYHFTIVEGWNIHELLAALAGNPVLERSLDVADPFAHLEQHFGVHPEGQFLPETYQFVRGDNDLDLLARAHADLDRVVRDAWQTRADGLPLADPYELLVLASIVEKESALESERDRIAGVFVRRLKNRWRLETDPTVIYGLGESFDGDIRRRDLDTDTPYNTYTRFGLPPTPIAMASESAIRAAANPAQGTAMFFVASGDGGHVFSDTLEEHNRAVRAMLKRRK